MKHLNPPVLITLLALSLLVISGPSLQAASRKEMRRQANAALNQLCSTNPTARQLRDSAEGVLVFPGIVKAGFIVGGQQGDGTLFEHGSATGYYKSIAASYGLQAGVQKFGYVLFFMTDDALAYLRKSEGWEIGSGPSVVLVDKGVAKTISSTTLHKGVYAFVFGQKGLMAGIGLQGTKITPIHPQ